MKKLFFLITLLINIVIFGSRSYAYTSTEIENNFLNVLNTNFNQNASYSSGNFNYVQDFLSIWNTETYSNKKLIMYIQDTTRLTYALVDSYTLTETNISYSYTRRMSYFISGSFAGRFSTIGLSGSTNADPYQNFMDFGNLEEFMNPISFDNNVLDPLLEVPSFYINNNKHSGNGNIDLSYNQANYSSPYQDITVYLYVKMYLYTPENIYADYSYFQTNSYYKSSPIEVFSFDDYHVSSMNATFDLNEYNVSVSSFLEYAAENRTIDGPSGMSAGTLLSRGVALSNMLLKGFPYGDNNIEVWACHYYISDGVVYQSNWKKWNSKRNSTYDKIVSVPNDYPTDGIIDVIDYGTIDIEEQNENDLYNPVGEVTGNNGVNVTVNTNVPNYPDYPTIKKYNHDSVLVQFIDTAKYLQDNENGFFGGFGKFLTATLGFIPQSYWTIVGFGLLGTIVVMIIKIL